MLLTWDHLPERLVVCKSHPMVVERLCDGTLHTLSRGRDTPLKHQRAQKQKTWVKGVGETQIGLAETPYSYEARVSFLYLHKPTMYLVYVYRNVVNKHKHINPPNQFINTENGKYIQFCLIRPSCSHAFVHMQCQSELGTSAKSGILLGLCFCVAKRGMTPSENWLEVERGNGQKAR